MGDNEISDAKNEGKSLAISIAMAMQRYVAGRIVGGPTLILAKNKFAPNAIFRVVSCLYIL